MRRKIPSTASLLAFEAAARHQSFTLAGEELSLTQSAIGRQIASLEELVGVKLFRRTRRGVVLSPAGLHYSGTVRQRLGDVERDARELAARSEGGGAVELGVVPTFATHWLIPRLPVFYASHPKVKVNLHVRTRPFLFADTSLDAAIHAGPGGWPGTRAERLMGEAMVVVCAPSWLARRKRLSAAEIVSLPLIRMTTRPQAWEQWLAQQGVRRNAESDGPRVELFSMALQAAVHGLGIALVPEYSAQLELQQGLLVQPVPGAFDSGSAYYLTCPEAAEGSGPFFVFREWVLRQAGEGSAPAAKPRQRKP